MDQITCRKTLDVMWVDKDFHALSIESVLHKQNAIPDQQTQNYESKLWVERMLKMNSEISFTIDGL